MLLSGLLMSGLAVAMAIGAFVLPAEARAGLVGAAIGVGLGGAVLVYLDWPSRRREPEGMARADAFVVEARLSGGEAAGSRMVEITLEVRPKGGVPFQATRKIIAGRSIEPGQKLAVYYDPADPQRIELA